MKTDEIRNLIVNEYKRRYPDWSDIRVTDLIDDYFGVHVAVVHANADDIEEICLFEPKTGVRIFSTTEELAQSLVEKAKAHIFAGSGVPNCANASAAMTKAIKTSASIAPNIMGFSHLAISRWIII